MDYYSEDVPALADEEQVLESFPDLSVNANSRTRVFSDIDENVDGLIIETDSLQRSKAKNADFESKIKDRLLYTLENHDNIHRIKDNLPSLELKKRNRILRFTMLENELRALMIEIEQDEQDSELPLKKKIDSLVRDIDAFKLNRGKQTFLDYWEGKLSVVNPPDITQDVNLSVNMEHNENDNDNANDSSTLFSEYDSRISELEGKLGYISPYDNTPSLQDSINDLYTRTNLILDGGNGVKEVESEILALINNCETYIKDSKRIKDKSEIIPLTDKKLCLLYNKVKKLPEFEGLLDRIIERFKSLNEIIISTSSTVNFMNGLGREMQNIESRLDHWDQKLDHLESQLEKDRETFENATKKLSG